MLWDPHRFFTREDYTRAAMGLAKRVMGGSQTPPFNGGRMLPYWWIERQIWISWGEDVPEKVADFITDTADETIREMIGLEFAFPMYGADYPTGQISGSAIEKEYLFSSLLYDQSRDLRLGGKPHGDIVITGKPFLNDKISSGCATFVFGAMVLSLDGLSSQSDYYDRIRRLVRHETVHLLGMLFHCDDFQNVEGYSYTPRCNMHYRSLTPDICPKCRDYLSSWWFQVAHEYEELHTQLQKK